MSRAELGQLVWIPIEKIVVRKDMIRKDLGDLSDLKSSIKLAGIISPIIVRPLENGMYELVCGRRRLEAESELGRKEVQAIVRPYDEKMARLVEIEENMRRKDYNSVERAKALAEYYEIVKEFLGEAKPGRPEGLTPEQIERAKQLRGEGKSLREIADELGTSHMAVKRALDREQAVTELINRESISLQESAPVPEKRPELEILPESPATRVVAEELGVSQPTIVRAEKTLDAIRKYPALERLGSVSDVLKVAKHADLLKCTAKEVSGAVDLIMSRDVDPVLAVYMQKIPKDMWEDVLAAYKEGKFPVDWIVEAVRLIYSNPEKGLTFERAMRCVVHAHKEYKVRLWHYGVVQALENAAKKAGVSEEQYIALAVLEKLYNEGMLSEMLYEETVKYVKQGGPRIVVL